MGQGKNSETEMINYNVDSDGIATITWDMPGRSMNVLNEGSITAYRDALGKALKDDKVKGIIVEQLGVDEEEVTPDASFVDDLGADSLDTVELVMAFEEEFGIDIPDEDADKMKTVGDALNYLQQHAAK